jgi:hypothetical protein
VRVKERRNRRRRERERKKKERGKEEKRKDRESKIESVRDVLLFVFVSCGIIISSTAYLSLQRCSVFLRQVEKPKPQQQQ